MELHPSGLPYPQTTKAYEDLDFLHSPSARNIRILCELTEPEQRLRRHGVRNTIVFFGSARTLPEEVTQANLEKVRRETAASDLPEAEKARLVRKAEFAVKNSRYYEDARRLAREITEWSKANFHEDDKRFYVCSGAGPGIMEAANRGASDVCGKSVGLGISLPFEQHSNPWVTKELNMEFHYFFVRKYWFFYLAKTMIVFPGGFGTMDELFELLTLVQTKKTTKRIPIVLYGAEFWTKLINFQHFIDMGLISEEDMNLFKIIDSVEEAKEYVIAEVTEHYVNREPGFRRPARLEH